MSHNSLECGARVAGRIALAVALGAGWLAGSGASSRAETPPVSAWISADAVFYAELPNPSSLLDRATDKRFLALVDAVPALKNALAGEHAKKLHEAVALVSDRLGKPWDEALRGLTGGGAVLAVEAAPGMPPGTILVITPDDAELLKKASAVLIELARKDAADNGRPDPIKSGEHRGVTGYELGKVSYAVVAGRLVIADRSETLNSVIDRSLDGPPEGRPIEKLPEWKAWRDAADASPETLAWAFGRLDRLRELDQQSFRVPEKPDTGATLLFGGWFEVFRKAPWVAANLSWTDRKLAAELAMPAPKDGRTGPFRGYVPPSGSGAPKLVRVPGTILSMSLWRDLSAIWEARADLVKPEEVQNLAKLDGFAGQFFGGRDFGSGVLGAATPDWRLVVALQDPKALSPVPDVKLPAVALVVDLKPDDDDFAQRLKVAFQSFVGLANIGAAQTKAPPLELLSEPFEGVTIATTRFMAPPANSKEKADDKAAVHYRHNFSPSAVQVGRHFVIASSVGLTRDLVKALKADASAATKPEDGTLVAEADGEALAKLVAMNRQRLVMQNILDKGNGQEQAEGEVDMLAALLKFLGQGRMSVKDGADLWKASLEFNLGH
jgi:hypothetical protein